MAITLHETETTLFEMNETWGDLCNHGYGYTHIPKQQVIINVVNTIELYRKDDGSFDGSFVDGLYVIGESLRANTDITLKEIASQMGTPLFEYDEKLAIGNKAYAAMVRGLSRLVDEIGSQPKERSIWAEKHEPKKKESVQTVINLLK